MVIFKKILFENRFGLTKDAGIDIFYNIETIL